MPSCSLHTDERERIKCVSRLCQFIILIASEQLIIIVLSISLLMPHLHSSSQNHIVKILLLRGIIVNPLFARRIVQLSMTIFVLLFAFHPNSILYLLSSNNDRVMVITIVNTLHTYNDIQRMGSLIMWNKLFLWVTIFFALFFQYLYCRL